MEQADVWPKISLDEVLNKAIKRQTFSEWNVLDSSHRTKGSRKILGHIWVFDGFWPQHTQRRYVMSKERLIYQTPQLVKPSWIWMLCTIKQTRARIQGWFVTQLTHTEKRRLYTMFTFYCLLWLKSLKTILLSFVPSCLRSSNNLYRKMWIQITHKKLNNF